VADIHVIVISSVRPEPTSAGQIILHRHLVDQTGITLEVYGTEPCRSTLSSLIRRVAGRLGRTRFHRFVEDLWVLWEGRWMDAELPQSIKNKDRTIVLTVAHGEGFMAAQRLAHRHRLPLVALYHDWWPDMARVHRPVQRFLERKFRELYSVADVAICVCPGMRETLGQNPKAQVLFPIPATILPASVAVSRTTGAFKIFYFGNLSDYGPMLGDLLEASLEHPEILIQVRGNNPVWSAERKAKMCENGRWLDFAPRHELNAWLASADAFLVPMVFDPSIRRRMETSFPSKLIEFAQLGKPIIIWGPEYCSAVGWAREGDKALCVTDSAPSAALAVLRGLRTDMTQLNNFTEHATEAANEEFCPKRLQAQFMAALNTTIGANNPSSAEMDSHPAAYRRNIENE
jgi:glycosyltransferase involved in cell wall biosynthesis